MSGQSPRSDAAWPAAVAHGLHEICDRFEADWRAGKRPRIEDFVGEMPMAYQPALERELIRLEAGLRRELNEVPRPEDYGDRFPELDSSAIESAIADSMMEVTRVEKLPASRSATTLAAGTRLGRYEIIGPLGAGGMGQVYRARDERLDRQVAIKVLPLPLAQEPRFLARFEREARAVAALSHPNILAIHDYGIGQGVSFAVMELLEGETLRQRVARAPLAWREALALGAAVADGLAAAHARGVIHRDLKPENLFLTSDGRIKILDFGLALVEPEAPADSGTGAYHPVLTDPGTVLGTAGYMSPEQIRGGTIDGRSDIFSLGCILYEMITGRRAFLRATPADTMAATLNEGLPKSWNTPQRIPKKVKMAVQRCVAKKTEERLASARDLAAALQAILRGSDAIISHQPRAPVSKDQKSRLRQTPASADDAYRHYLRGRYYWNKRTEEDFHKSIAHFQKAIEQDPTYAPAYAGLADVHALLGSWGLAPPKTSFEVAKRFAERARQLDENLAEAHVALAYVHMVFDWSWQEAEAGFRRAIELDPDNSVAQARFAYLLMILGRFEEALERMKRAQELDPVSLIISANVGYVLYFMRRYDQAIDQLRITLAMEADFPTAHYYLGLVYEQQGKYDQAIAALKKAIALGKSVPGDLHALGHAYAMAGRMEEALAVLDELLRLSACQYVPSFFIGFSHLSLGENESGFAWLERAYDERDFYLIYLQVDPRLARIRDDSRMADLIARMRFPAARPPDTQERSAQSKPQNSEAYRLYVKGRYYWNKRTEEGLRESIVVFYQALDKDPSYALAWAGLAEAYHQLGLWGHAPPTSACSKGKSAALKAIEFDDKLGEAHAGLAVILKDYDWDFAAAERSFRRALELNPSHAVAHQWYGECLACVGRHAEAIAELRRAQQLDPLSINISATLGRQGYFFARQFEQAVEQFRKTIETDQNFWIAHNFLGWVYVFRNEFADSVAAFETARRLDDNPETFVGLGYAHALAGETAKAENCLDALTELAKQRYVAPVNFAVVYAGLGRKDEAFSWLERACDDRSQWLSEIRVDPVFDPLRSDQRFAQLLGRLKVGP